MATTPNLAIPYPAATDAPDGPGGLYAAVTRLDALSTPGTVGHAGTVIDWGISQGSSVTRMGYLGVLTFNVNPGANGISNATTNNLLINSSILPLDVTRARVILYKYNLGFQGGSLDLEFGLDGGLRCIYGSAGDGDGVFGVIPFRCQ